MSSPHPSWSSAPSAVPPDKSRARAPGDTQERRCRRKSRRGSPARRRSVAFLSLCLRCWCRRRSPESRQSLPTSRICRRFVAARPRVDGMLSKSFRSGGAVASPTPECRRSAHGDGGTDEQNDAGVDGMAGERGTSAGSSWVAHSGQGTVGCLHARRLRNRPARSELRDRSQGGAASQS